MTDHRTSQNEAMNDEWRRWEQMTDEQIDAEIDALLEGDEDEDDTEYTWERGIVPVYMADDDGGTVLMAYVVIAFVGWVIGMVTMRLMYAVAALLGW